MKKCLTNLSFLFLSPVSFAQLWQRHQAFAVELARLGAMVYFLEPYLSGGFGVSESFWEGCPQTLRLLKVRVPFKASAWCGLNSIATKFAMLQVRKHIDVSNTILWVAEPYMALFTRLRFEAIIYDKCDLHGAFPGQREKVWASYEEPLFQRADLILASHPYLLSSMPASLGRVLLVPNAVSPEYLRDVSPTQPSEIEPAKRELQLISAGAHFEWTDFDWLNALVSANEPAIKLHIAGRGRGSEFEKLIKHPNVIFHKQLSKEKLSRLMRACDVGLIPFKDLRLIRGVDPIKAYEYAASGLQVWAPDICALHSNPFVTHFVSVKGASVIKEVAAYKVDKVPVWADRLESVLEALEKLV